MILLRQSMNASTLPRQSGTLPWQSVRACRVGAISDAADLKKISYILRHAVLCRDVIFFVLTKLMTEKEPTSISWKKDAMHSENHRHDESSYKPSVVYSNINR